MSLFLFLLSIILLLPPSCSSLRLMTYYDTLINRLGATIKSEPSSNSKYHHHHGLFGFDEIETLKDFHIYCKLHAPSERTTVDMLDKFLLRQREEKKDTTKNVEVFVSSNDHPPGDRFVFNTICTGMLMHDTKYVLSAYYLTENNLKTLGEHFCFVLDMQEMESLLYPTRRHNPNHHHYHHIIDTPYDVLFFEVNSLTVQFNDELWQTLMKYRILEI